MGQLPASTPRLVLWDIDGTLLRTRGASVGALVQAGRALFGEVFTLDGIDFSGRLDPHILREVAAVNGARDADAIVPRLRALYAGSFDAHLAAGPPPRLLPGVGALVEHLHGDPGVVQGVLTGNYAETGTLKITHAGLRMEHFAVRVWGDDAPTRADLVARALEAYARQVGAACAPQDVTVIGDTPRDVECARAHGCRVLAVATGVVPRTVLEASAPDLVLDDLSDVAAVLRWLQA